MRFKGRLICGNIWYFVDIRYILCVLVENLSSLKNELRILRQLQNLALVTVQDARALLFEEISFNTSNKQEKY